MEKNFFIKNRQALLERVEDNSLIVFFAGNARHKTADENYSFTPNRNFYYLTGIDEENLILMLAKTNNEVKLQEYLYVEKSDPVLAKWVGEKISRDEAEKASGIEEIGFLEEFEGTFHKLLNSNKYDNLYLDLERMNFEQPISRPQEFAEQIIKKYPFVKIRNSHPIISRLRTIKTEEEIENIRTAIKITNEGIENIMRNAGPGMMEYEMEAYFDFTLKSKGVKDFAFKTIAGSGVNATVLHYDQNNSKALDNELILFDLGAQYNYYNADITRTFPVNGRFTERQKEIYNIVLKAQLAVINTIKPGIEFKELNESCKAVLAEECKKIGLIKDEKELSKYYYHGVSHFLGLDTHDVGSRDVVLTPGMVLTVEPGLYIEEEKIGIRIEDDVLVTGEGFEVLSDYIVKSVDEIEKFMQK